MSFRIAFHGAGELARPYLDVLARRAREYLELVIPALQN